MVGFIRAGEGAGSRGGMACQGVEPVNPKNVRPGSKFDILYKVNIQFSAVPVGQANTCYARVIPLSSATMSRSLSDQIVAGSLL